MYTLNGKEYKDIQLTYNEVCKLDEKGIDISKIDINNASTFYLFRVLRAIIAISFGGNDEIAGNEIEAHIVNGGKIEDLVEVLNKALANSGFFQALNKKA